MTKETSQRIANMSVVCAILVVLIHVDWPKANNGWLWWIGEFVKGGIAQIAVPFFFVVSGYFLAAHFDEPGYWQRELKKRVRTLLVPFVLWLLICFILTAPLSIVADLMAHRPFGTSLCLNNGRWLTKLGLNLTTVPGLVPLWYIRCLFLFVSTSFVFQWLVRRFKLCELLMAWGLWMLYMLRPFGRGDFFYNGYSLSGVFFFSVGIYIRLFKVSKMSRRGAFVCAFMGVGLLVAEKVLPCFNIKFIIPLAGLYLPLLMYAVYCFMPSQKWPKWLTSSSFPIFLIHTIIIWYCNLGQKYVSMPEPVFLLLEMVLALGGSLLITLFLRRHFPQAASVLFGGR